MAELNIRGTANPKQDLDKFFDDEVKLMQKEKEQAGDYFNRLRDIMMKKLREMTPWTWNYLNSGSHYDGVKVSRADEMDCMFFPNNIPQDWLEVVHDDTPPEYCYIKLRAPRGVDKSDPKYSRLQDLCEGDRLSSALYKDMIFEAFEAGRQEHRHAKVDPDSKPDCPSFMVLLDTVPRSDGRRGRRTISIDLLPALKLEGWPSVSKACLRSLNKDDADEIKRAGFHVIPKHCKERAFSKTKHLLWRLSYSSAEKHLTLHADGVLNNPPGNPTCRKLVMRILKRMLEVFKELNNSPAWKEPNASMSVLKNATLKLLKEKPDGFHVSKFTSFQIRTLMWTEYFKHHDSGYWAQKSRRGRLQDALFDLLELLSGNLHLQHFFVPDLDIMKDVPRDEREYLYTLFYIAKEMF